MFSVVLLVCHFLKKYIEIIETVRKIVHTQWNNVNSEQILSLFSAGTVLKVFCGFLPMVKKTAIFNFKPKNVKFHYFLFAILVFFLRYV